MDLLHLVDRLEELVAAAQKMPIGSRAIVDRRRLLDIVDQMRISIPQDVREAEDMVRHRDEVMREAEEEARIIVARAEQRAARLVEDHEIAVAARQRAQEIAVHAEARLEERIAEANQDIQERLADSRRLADEQMSAADAYARELLARLATQLHAFVNSVETGIEQLQPEDAPARRPSILDESDDEGWTLPRGAAYGGTAGSAGSVASYDDDLDEPDHEDDDDDERESGDRVGAPLPLRRAIEDEANLLRRPSRETPREQPAPVEPGVIDDFDLPSLDDDPTQARQSTTED